MIRFKIAKESELAYRVHRVQHPDEPNEKRDLIEVWQGAKKNRNRETSLNFIAAIYPHKDHIVIESKYLGVVLRNLENTNLPTMPVLGKAVIVFQDKILQPEESK